MAEASATILIVEANPQSPVLDRLRTTPEIKELLQRLPPKGFSVKVGLALAPGEIQGLLREHKPDILHFAGHGGPDGSLVAETATGSPATIPMEALAEELRLYNRDHQDRLRLVVLNACYSAKQATELTRFVSCVIGATAAIADRSAKAFALEFFSALGDEGNVDAAFQHGCAQVDELKLPPVRKRLVLASRAGVDPADIRFRASISPLHLDYLRAWFGETWATVSLADLSEHDERVRLVDIYVPLPVDFRISVQWADDGTIADWWEAIEHRAGKTAPAPEVQDDAALELRKERGWPSLRVLAEGMRPVLQHFQAKAQLRGTAPTATKGAPSGQEDAESTITMEAHDAASVQPRFVLIGDPGSGKTSFLRHLALCHAGELRRRAGDDDVPEFASVAALRDWLLGPLTPLYVELHDLVSKALPDPTTKASVNIFLDYVASHLHGGRHKAFLPELDTLLRSGQVLIVLDGLDEVPDGASADRRKQMQDMVAALHREFGRSRIIVTSRPYAYREGEWSLAGFGRAELRHLSTNRLSELATALFGCVRRGHSLEDAPAEAGRFIEAIKQGDIPHDMRGTPLFFTLLAALWLHAPDGTAPTLPATKGELYRQSVDLLLTKWTRNRPQAASVAKRLGCDSEQLRTLLEIVARTVHADATATGEAVVFPRKVLLDALFQVNGDAPPRGVLDYLERQAGILISPKKDHFRFVHWSFQEYLAACGLLPRTGSHPTPPGEAEDEHRVFPSQLVQKVMDAAELWSNVAHLAADELIRREHSDELVGLITALIDPVVTSGSHARSAMLALTICDKAGLIRKPVDRFDRQIGFLNHLQEAALCAVTDLSLIPAERAEAGRHLATLGDLRPGVGLGTAGLPAFDWCTVLPGTVIVEDGIGESTVDQGFRISRYQVTYAQYKAFVDAEDGYDNPHWRRLTPALHELQAESGKQEWPSTNHPAENVSWYDAMAFCRWVTHRLQEADDPDLAGGLEIRLPTEAEWQLAAGGPETKTYPWGPDYEVGRANVDESRLDSGTYLRRTTAVGIYPNGKADCGAWDMAGNIWEWTLSDREGEHNVLTDARPRVLRGGSWYFFPDYARASYRFSAHPGNRDRNFGFRVVLAAPVP